MDRKPQVRIEIDESAILKIDSLELVTNSYYYGVEKEASKVQENIKEYIFGNEEDFGIIRLKLKDKTNIKLDSVKLRNTDWLTISQVNGTYKVEPRNESKIAHYLKILLVSLIIVFFTKVASALVIISPVSSKDFILKYGLFNLIYVFVSALLISAGDGGLILFCLATFALLFVDFNFLYKYCRKGGITRPLIAVIVGNLLLFTIGVGSIFIIAMLI
jgi:hypothetical protein